MIKYSLYLLYITLRKTSTSVLLIFFSIIFGGLLALTSKSNKSPLPTILYLWEYFYYILFLFGCLYIGVKAINIFKEGLNNGTELLIISRPISRNRIIISKFFVMFIHIFIFSLVVFLTCLSVAQIENGKATQKQILNFSLSLSTGSLIIGSLLSAIIIFISSIASKIGTLISTAFIPFILIVSSAVITLVSKGDTNGQVYRRYVFNTKWEKHNSEEWLKGSDSFASDTKGYFRQQEGWYDNVKYIDVFTQLSSFYKNLLPEVNIPAKPIKIIPTISKFTSDIEFFGLDTKDKPANFIFVPWSNDNNFFKRKVWSKINDNKTLITEEIYDFMVKNYKQPLPSTQKQFEKETATDVKNFVDPGDILDPNNIQANKVSQRMKTNMAKIIIDYFKFFEARYVPHKNNKDDIIANALNYISNYEKHDSNNLHEAIIDLTNKFLLGSAGYKSVPMIISIYIYRKIFKRKIEVQTTTGASKLDLPMVTDFRKLVFKGKYELKSGSVVDFSKDAKDAGILEQGGNIKSSKFVSWVPRKQVYEIWISLTVIFLAITIFRYFKVDFK
ncbi:MAG: ABC transporter permease subunit [Mycoplasma sp.]|nr:ABC transporter permease subunit [Mycoplasma sp.]